jgi:hypothetical protein
MLTFTVLAKTYFSIILFKKKAARLHHFLAEKA